MMIYIDWKKFGAMVKYKLDLMGVSVADAARQMNIGRTRLYDIVSGNVDEQVRKSTLSKVLRFIKLKEDAIPVKAPEKVSNKTMSPNIKNIIDELNGMSDNDQKMILQYIQDYKILQQVKSEHYEKKKKLGRGA